MNSQVQATNLLEKAARRAHSAELYQVRSVRLPVAFRGGALESVKAIELAGRALRLIHDDRLGFSTTTDLTDDETLIQNALESARFGDPAPFAFPAGDATEPVDCFDAEVEVLDAADLIALGEQAIDRIHAYDPDLQVDVSITRQVEEVHLLNTNGLERQERRTLLGIEIDITRAQEGDIMIVYDVSRSRRRADVDGLALADSLVDKLRRAERTVTVESKAMPVVFESMGTLALLLPLMAGLNGRNVYLGTSPLSDKLGQQALDPRLTLVDDGRLPFAGRSGSFDDEGILTASRPLIEAGVIRHFMYDLKTAGQAGAAPTGNGFKGGLMGGGGFEQPPGVSPTTWTIDPGEQSRTQLLAGLDETLLVQQVIGLGQGNILAGEFSNNVSVGLLVRRGEIVGRVKNTMIAGNAYELLRERLIGLSDRPEWILGMLRAPAIAVDGVGVAG